MGQIHGPDLGAPAARVTSGGELFVTGSMSQTAQGVTDDILVERESQTVMSDILKEVKKISFQLENMTGIQIRNADIE